MSLRVVRLGQPRQPDEGLRLGTVRRPPRGVPKAEFAQRDFYDLWLPVLAPSAELLKQAKSLQDDRAWAAFSRRFHVEMRQNAAAQTIALLAALSHSADFSVGCYCLDESRCHRSILRQLFEQAGARV
jgi:uncharacterized protein YeaO (DUF488 family)